MLTFDPAKRATAIGALQHRYFTEAPAPQEPRWMPTWREHRNEAANPRNPVQLPAPARSRRADGPGAKRAAPLAPRSAVFAAAKKAGPMIQRVQVLLLGDEVCGIFVYQQTLGVGQALSAAAREDCVERAAVRPCAKVSSAEARRGATKGLCEQFAVQPESGGEVVSASIAGWGLRAGPMESVSRPFFRGGGVESGSLGLRRACRDSA
ncbi:unnamed protein product [Prorocentrum cordatum]|uniref:Uncharacterized protein n=1 Tax=Prorocentrum cordatum TaxID=2364126 RepID=A0ABN9QXT0_9DINO|nr:unnamed protein product [Polarella glacialis]